MTPWECVLQTRTSVDTGPPPAQTPLSRNRSSEHILQTAPSEEERGAARELARRWAAPAMRRSDAPVPSSLLGQAEGPVYKSRNVKGRRGSSVVTHSLDILQDK